jgi:NADPH2:quinone reductase
MAMKAWLLRDFTGLGALQLVEDAPEPTAGPGEVVLAPSVAALNPADRYLAEKLYPARPTLPHILGRDGAGTIVAVGAGVTQWRVGDKALILRGEAGVSRPGTLATRVALPADVLAPIPSGWSLEEAGAGALVYLTAWQALTQWGRPPAGTWVLITGASGGVGLAAIHLAEALELRAIGLSRSAAKGKALLDQGAQLAIDPASPDWVKQVRTATAPDGVGVCIDNIGGPLFNLLPDVMGNMGGISVVGRLAGPVPEFNTAKLFFRRLRIGGVAVGSYTPAEAQSNWRTIVELLARTGRRPVVDSIHPMEALPAAFARLAEGPMGKVLVRVNG